MSGLAEGKKGFEKYTDLLKKNFVMLNVYCTSVKDEHDPRGPEGPYQFTDKSVPVVVIKRWNGETFVQQLGFGGKGDQAMKRVANWIDKSLKENGRVLPPKKLRPIVTAMSMGAAFEEKGKLGQAFSAYRKAQRVGANKKDFPAGLPKIAEDAKSRADALLEQLNEGLEEAREDADVDPKAVRKKLRALLKSWGPARDQKKRIQAAMKALPKDE